MERKRILHLLGENGLTWSQWPISAHGNIWAAHQHLSQLVSKCVLVLAVVIQAALGLWASLSIAPWSFSSKWNIKNTSSLQLSLIWSSKSCNNSAAFPLVKAVGWPCGFPTWRKFSSERASRFSSWIKCSHWPWFRVGMTGCRKLKREHWVLSKICHLKWWWKWHFRSYSASGFADVIFYTWKL